MLDEDKFTEPITWNVSQIVGADEATAKSILVQILQGGDFAQIAQAQSKAANAAQVTSHEIDDHDVFCAILLTGAEFLTAADVFLQRSSTRRRSFHWSNRDVPSVNLEEEFRGERNDLLSTRVKECSIGYGMPAE